MYLSTSIGFVAQNYNMSVFEVIDTLKRAGFEYLDMTFMSYLNTDLSSDNWIEWTHKIKEHADKCGIKFNQTHGTFVLGSQWDDPEYTRRDEILGLNERCIEASKILGAKWMVIHPCNLPHDPIYSAKKAKQANIEYLAPFIDKAKQHGIGLAVENMIDFSNNRRRYCGGDPYELLDLVDTINDPDVKICIDVGHANLAGVDPASYIRLAGDRIKALHIDDNLRDGDKHLIPFRGNIDWNSVTKALKDIEYNNDFSFELRKSPYPLEVLDSYLKFVYDLGMNLIK